MICENTTVCSVIERRNDEAISNIIRKQHTTEEDFNNILILDLQNRGYGWLRPEGVRIKLDELQFGW